MVHCIFCFIISEASPFTDDDSDTGSIDLDDLLREAEVRLLASTVELQWHEH